MTLREFDRLAADERDYWIAEWDYSRRQCERHGGPLEDCQDPEKPWYPQRQVCRAAMVSAAANALYEERHKDAKFHDGTFPESLQGWSTVRTLDFPYRYDEGVTIFAAPEDLNPDDQFLGPPPKQRTGEQGQSDE